MSSDNLGPAKYDEVTTARIESLKAELASLEADTEEKLEEMAEMGLVMDPSAIASMLEQFSSEVFMEIVLGDEHSVARHEYNLKVQERFRETWLMPSYEQRDEIKAAIKDRQARAALLGGIAPGNDPGSRYLERTGAVDPRLIQREG